MTTIGPRWWVRFWDARREAVRTNRDLERAAKARLDALEDAARLLDDWDDLAPHPTPLTPRHHEQGHA